MRKETSTTARLYIIIGWFDREEAFLKSGM